MSKFSNERATDLAKRIDLDLDGILSSIVGLSEELGEVLITTWGYFGALQEIKRLQDTIILNSAYEMIASCDTECLDFDTEKCSIDNIEIFKVLAREQLKKEEII